VEEIAPAAEGVASDDNRHTSTPTGPDRIKSWHGTQVPGKPKINRPLMSEMGALLAKRRDKVDKESYVSEGPDPVKVPELVCLPPSGPRKPSTTSIDSGRGESVEPTRQNSQEPGGYSRVSVDRDRKEELKMAKAVRQSSAKILGRASPGPNWVPNTPSTAPSPVTVKQEEDTVPGLAPSPVVMRYWKQCSSSTADSGYFGEEGLETEDVPRDANGEVIPPWKLEAIEGEETEFPSIANKIKQMEEEAKRPLAMYEVPDVKSKMNTGAPAAKWMEARGKLQQQLDTLITKTSEKMAKYGSVHVKEKVEFTKDGSSENESSESNEKATKSPSPEKVVDNQVKNLIKTVANEIQKSFSTKSMNVLNEDDDGYQEDVVVETKEESEEEKIKREEKEKVENTKKMINEVKRRQKHVEMEAPILDFELKEPTPEPEPEEVEEDNDPLPPGTLNFSAAKSKVNMRRKTSSERRLPAGILAKRKASETATGVSKVDASTATDSPFTEIELAVAEKMKRKELFSHKVQQTQWEISNAEYEMSKLSDNEKAELLTQQISKLKSKHVNKLLQSIDTGVLDISLPLLVPFLSLQARMSLGTNLYKNKFKIADAEAKNKMAKETFVDMMLKDITDIALLQEVIERSQEKLLLLSAEEEKRFAEKLRKGKLINVENDSFDLGSSPDRRSVTPVVAASPRRSVTPCVKEASPQIVISNSPRRSLTPCAKEASPEILEALSLDSDEKTASSSDVKVDILPEEEEELITEKETINKTEIVSLEEKKTDDEGCPSSESDSDKEEEKTKDLKDDESDEGLGKSDDNITAKIEDEEEEEPPKQEIKQKILNILQDAKAMDQKRNIRNFGRTFEFQGVKEALRPVLPNDKRPTKARKLDLMWNQVTAAKQGFNTPSAVPTLEELKARRNATKIAPPTLEELKAKKTPPTLEELKAKKNTSQTFEGIKTQNNVAKTAGPTLEEQKSNQKSIPSNVPWTRKGNTLPPSKEALAAQQEVEEFQSCRKTLQENVKSEVDTIRKIQIVKKDEILTICKSKEDSIEQDVIETVADGTKQIICDEATEQETETVDATNDVTVEKETVETSKEHSASPVRVIKTESVTSFNAEDKDEGEEIPKDNKSPLKETSTINATTDADNSDSEAASEVEWEVSDDEEVEAIVEEKEVIREVKEKTPDVKENTPEVKEKTPEIKEKTPEEKLETAKRKENTPEKCLNKPVIPPKPFIPVKEMKSLLISSPVVRRRGETSVGSSSITVCASIRLPPPPSFRPPPPPVSPPVPLSKVKDLEKTNGKIIDFKSDETSSDEEEEVSEWEYESESE